MAQDSPQAKYSEQYILNNIYDQVLRAIAVFGVGWNGQTADVFNSDNLALKMVMSGEDIYIGEAAPGTTLATAKWRAYKYTASTKTITYADGNATYDNVATDLTALTYS